MTKTFQQTLSSQAPFNASGITHAPQSLADTELTSLAGGAEHGEISFTFGLSLGTSHVALPFSSDLQQMPAGALDPNTVPWAELTPPIKGLVIVDRADV